MLEFFPFVLVLLAGADLKTDKLVILSRQTLLSTLVIVADYFVLDTFYHVWQTITT